MILSDVIEPKGRGHKRDPNRNSIQPLRQVLLAFSEIFLAGTGGNSYRFLSLSTLVLDEHESQDDIVQHMHPCRLYLEPCLSFLDDVVCPVKFSNHRLLLVSGYQLDTAIRHNVSTERSCGVNRNVPWGSSSPSNPSPICTGCRLGQ